jgi:hypothetical protein
MRHGDHVALRQVELRDAAVRVLHRAISHVLEGQEAQALAALQGPRAREWYEDVSEYSGLTCVLSEREVA